MSAIYRPGEQGRGAPDRIPDCAACGATLPARANFCGSCGAGTGAGSPPEQPFRRPTALIVASLICSAIALLFLPPVFGGLAIYLGWRAYRRSPRVGPIYMIVGALCLLIGALFGVLTAVVFDLSYLYEG